VISDTYQPGEPLLDGFVPALLTPGLYHADGQIDGEVYEYGSFLQSKMYRQGVTCTNCHAPHSLRLRAAGNAVCAQCHLASKYDSAAHHFHRPDSAGGQCVAKPLRDVRTIFLIQFLLERPVEHRLPTRQGLYVQGHAFRHWRQSCRNPRTPQTMCRNDEAERGASELWRTP